MGYKWKQYRRYIVECPYYKKEDRQVIYCSGVVADSSIHLAFAMPSECKVYKQKICSGNYKECKVYQMLEELNNE